MGDANFDDRRVHCCRLWSYAADRRLASGISSEHKRAHCHRRSLRPDAPSTIHRHFPRALWRRCGALADALFTDGLSHNVIAYSLLARKEEQQMMKKFGDKYRAYQQRVPMFLPDQVRLAKGFRRI